MYVKSIGLSILSIIEYCRIKIQWRNCWNIEKIKGFEEDVRVHLSTYLSSRSIYCPWGTFTKNILRHRENEFNNYNHTQVKAYIIETNQIFYGGRSNRYLRCLVDLKFPIVRESHENKKICGESSINADSNNFYQSLMVRRSKQTFICWSVGPAETNTSQIVNQKNVLQKFCVKMQEFFCPQFGMKDQTWT